MVDVSVIVPTRDRPAWLANAVSSALAQRGVTVELIVVDDCSAVPVAAERLAPDGRVIVHRHAEGRGVSAARNTGIAKAGGSWIAFLDDDDVWAPTKLARQLAAATESDRDWAYAGYADVGPGLELLGGLPPADPDEVMDLLPSHNSVPAGASNVVVRSATLANAGGFDEALRVHEDWDLWLRLARLGPPACAPAPLVALRWHPDNASAGMAAMLRDLPRIAERHGVPVDYPRHLRWAAWSALAAGRRRDAVRWYLAAAARGDRRSYGRAAMACALPRTAARRAARGRRPNDWMMAADEWLRDLR